MFNWKSEEEENREEVNLNQDAMAEENTTAGSASAQVETPGTEQGEGTAGNSAEENPQEEAAEETLEDVKAELVATAALLKTKEEEATEIKNRLLRLQADFDNFRRRNATEREELATYVTISVVNKFLQILDNFERAEAAAEKAIDVQSVHDSFVSYMTDSDVWIKSAYLGNKYVHCVCLKEYKPTTVSLQRGDNSYIIGTITLHCLDAPKA